MEAGHIGEGQTGNTTAKITAQHGLIFDGLITSLGMERAELYAKANQTAIEEYRQLVERLGSAVTGRIRFPAFTAHGIGRFWKRKRRRQ